MEFDEKELRREIAFAIRNIHGMLTPFFLKLFVSMKNNRYMKLQYCIGLANTKMKDIVFQNLTISFKKS